MIDLYTWTTPNGRKVSIMLEEVGLPYRVHSINIGKDEQFAPDYMKINPNGKIPSIVDPGRAGRQAHRHDGIRGDPHLPRAQDRQAARRGTRGRTRRSSGSCSRWAAWAPCSGRSHHFLRAAKEQVPYAIERYSKETKRLYGVLNERLKGNDYLAGEYSIADIATYPWVARYEWHKTDSNDFPDVKRWFDAISARPAVKKGMAVPS